MSTPGSMSSGAVAHWGVITFFAADELLIWWVAPNFDQRLLQYIVNPRLTLYWMFAWDFNLC